jgi:hypothetical protein
VSLPFRRSIAVVSVTTQALAGCMPDVKPAPFDASTFCDARAELEAAEHAFANPRKQNVALELSAPYMPTRVEARGAAAMGPPGDLRMILLGPGGATALDLWLHEGRFRFEVPALGRVLRGDRSTPPEKKRGLPVDFLRWWMLDPLRGELLSASRDAAGIHFELRDGAAYVNATLAPNGEITAVRTTWAESGEKLDEETLSASRMGCGHVEYHQDSTDLTVKATCESESSDVPLRAFVDPDASVP